MSHFEYAEAYLDDHGIMHLVMSRPQKANALSHQMINELARILLDADNNPRCRVVILSARGKNFCAGYDFQWVYEMVNNDHDQNIKEAKHISELLFILYNMKKPTIALVQGAALSVGVGLVSCCDIVISTRTARYCQTETRMGIYPALAIPFMINAMGHKATKRYVVTAEVFSAKDAYRFGLVDQLVWRKKALVKTGMRIAKRLINNGPNATSLAKQHVNKMVYREITPELNFENASLITSMGLSYEAQQGIRAYLNKKAAFWNRPEDEDGSDAGDDVKDNKDYPDNPYP